MRHLHLPPADPRSSWVARIALAAALLGSAIVTFAIGFYDPFGQRHATADAVSRDTTAVVLCALVETTEQRARDIEAQRGEDWPSAARARASAHQLRMLARDLLDRDCGPRGNATDTTTPEGTP